MTQTPFRPGAPEAPASPIAPLARRAVACLIDLAIVWVVVIVGYAIVAVALLSARTAAAVFAASMIGLSVLMLVLLAWFLVFSFLQGHGASLGMRLMRLRLVRADTGAPLGFGRALLRNVVFGLSASIVVGYFTPLFDGSGRFQGWHDRAAGALVLDVRGTVPAPQAETYSAPAAPAPVSPAMPSLSTADDAFAPPQAAPHPAAEYGSATGHTLPHAPSSTGHVRVAPVAPTAPAAPVEFDADPIDATVTSEAAQAARAAQEAESAMITVVPGISPSVPAPASVPLSGPEAPAAPSVPAPVVQPLGDEDDPEDTRISIPGHRLLFVWDDGARATVSGRTLFGRNPARRVGVRSRRGA